MRWTAAASSDGTKNSKSEHMAQTWLADGVTCRVLAGWHGWLMVWRACMTTGEVHTEIAKCGPDVGVRYCLLFAVQAHIVRLHRYETDKLGHDFLAEKLCVSANFSASRKLRRDEVGDIGHWQKTILLAEIVAGC